MKRACLSLWLLSLLAVSACGGPSPDNARTGSSEPVTTGDVFIAFADDFSGFHEWPSFPVYDEAGIGDPVHPDHQLTEYINHPKAQGIAQFPVGTIIVKEGSLGDPSTRQFFGMVKRGGNYNETGVVGWEWFELRNQAEPASTVSIVWRGFGPPLGEVYGGDAKAGCNECHLTAEHDAVFGPAGD